MSDRVPPVDSDLTLADVRAVLAVAERETGLARWLREQGTEPERVAQAIASAELYRDIAGKMTTAVLGEAMRMAEWISAAYYSDTEKPTTPEPPAVTPVPDAREDTAPTEDAATVLDRPSVTAFIVVPTDRMIC